MNSQYKTLNSCVCCGASSLEKVLDLGAQPLANSYHNNTSALPEYPLGVNLCANCFHVQQFVAVDPDHMFKDYAYVSGTSTTLREYFAWFADMVMKNSSASGSKKVLDIACNDGSQLAAFKALGWQTFGVDPAENLIDRAAATGAEVICDYWTKEIATSLETTFDAIIAQNVFAHTAEPLLFLEAAKLVMDEHTKLYIQTSQAHMFLRGEFDTIYHEHISFFSARSIQAVAQRAGLKVTDIFITDIHGGSYVFVLEKNGSAEKIEQRIAEEEQTGRYERATHKQFAARALGCVRTLSEVVSNYKNDGYTVVGFGAAAKGNTLLNFGKIQLDYIVDDNALKQGLYTPGMNVPIYSPERLHGEHEKLVVIPLAWNFFTEIKAKAESLREGKNTIFITYFPELQVHSSHP